MMRIITYHRRIPPLRPHHWGPLALPIGGIQPQQHLDMQHAEDERHPPDDETLRDAVLPRWELVEAERRCPRHIGGGAPFAKKTGWLYASTLKL